MINRHGWVLKGLVLWGPVLGYIGLIFVLSSMSNPPAVGSAPNLDKIAHFVEYGILGCLLGWALGFPSRGERAWAIFFLAIGVGTLVGLGDEMYQGTVPGREKSYWDLTMDVAGLTAAQILLFWWSSRRRGTGQ